MSYDRNRLPDSVSFYEAEGVPLKGRGPWRNGPCGFHGGSDSFRVNVDSGGFICMNCGVKGGDVVAFVMERYGVDFVTAAKRLGAWVDDGKPEPTKPLPFNARAALEVLRRDALLCAVVMCDAAKGEPISDVDRAAALEAVSRIEFVAGAVA